MVFFGMKVEKSFAISPCFRFHEMLSFHFCSLSMFEIHQISLLSVRYCSGELGHIYQWYLLNNLLQPTYYVQLYALLGKTKDI